MKFLIVEPSPLPIIIIIIIIIIYYKYSAEMECMLTCLFFFVSGEYLVFSIPLIVVGLFLRELGKWQNLLLKTM